MPVFGAALGAASGALSGALSDFGINDQFMKELSAKLQTGNAALFLLIHKLTADKVLDAVKPRLITQKNKPSAMPSQLLPALAHLPAVRSGRSLLSGTERWAPFGANKF
jgi:hypothetical protein